jgi:type IV pilus biogenesis protein PilP
VKPRQRPANFANIVDRAQRSRPAAATAAAVPAAATATPRIPSSASVARQATITNAINLRKLNLLGVSGTPSNRSALVRLPGGGTRTVQVGDRLDGGRVVAIGEAQLQYQKGGRNQTLKIPE